MKQLEKKLESYWRRQFLSKGMPLDLAQSNAEFMVEAYKSHNLMGPLAEYVRRKPEASHEDSKQQQERLSNLAAPSSHESLSSGGGGVASDHLESSFFSVIFRQVEALRKGVTSYRAKRGSSSNDAPAVLASRFVTTYPDVVIDMVTPQAKGGGAHAFYYYNEKTQEVEIAHDLIKIIGHGEKTVVSTEFDAKGKRFTACSSAKAGFSAAASSSKRSAQSLATNASPVTKKKASGPGLSGP